MLRQLVIRFGIVTVVALAASYPFICKNEAGNSTSSVTPKNEKTLTKAVVKKPKYDNVHLPDFAAIRDVKEKKKAFFGFMKPFVVEVNTEILALRQFVLKFDPNNSKPAEQKKLIALAKKYRVKDTEDLAAVKDRLINRVDIIPVDLVLMQAANESGWGTSRFALEANNLFGQWCFRKGCGVIPSGRPAGKTYEVRKFKTPADSIRSYFHNLNTGHAYKDLRQLRRKNREINESLDPYLIAEGLLPYSTRREAYVEEIQHMLRINKKYI